NRLTIVTRNTYANIRNLHSFPTRRSSDLEKVSLVQNDSAEPAEVTSKDLADVIELVIEDTLMSIFEDLAANGINNVQGGFVLTRSEEHTSELQSRFDLVCRLLLEKKNVNE